MSKGSIRRPQQVPDDAMSDSWSAIFERNQIGLPVYERKDCGKKSMYQDEIHTCSPQQNKEQNESR